MSARDTQRSKVYAAEEFVRTLFDRAGEHGNRTIEFFGTNHRRDTRLERKILNERKFHAC